MNIHGNNFAGFRDKLNWFLQRSFVLYFILFFLFTISVDYRDLTGKGRGAALSRLMPPHEYLISYLLDPASPNRLKLKEFVYYYNQLLEYMPYTADAFGMLGFVYYQMGQTEKAVSAYQRAIELNPIYFWFYYNKGLIHFKNGEYKESLELFRQGMTTSPDSTMSFTYMSKVFVPFRDITRDFDDTINLRLQKAYKNCFKLVLMSQYFLKDYPGVLASANYALRQNFEDKAFFYHYSGIAAYKIGELKSAAALLQDSVRLKPGDREAFEYLVKVWQALGREDLAAPFKVEAARTDLPPSPFDELKGDLSLQIF